jgi:salicylate hydroxylase
MNQDRIVIVGGGIGGMTAAVALAQAGLPVTLLEAAPAFGDIGAGVTLSPNAMKGFAHLGIEEQVAAAGIEPTRQRIQHWRDGRTLVPIVRAGARERYGASYVYIHRADLHTVLVEAAQAAGAQLEKAAAVDGIADDGVSVKDGRFFPADVVVGADGLKSVVRRLFEAEVAHFTGHVAWRALVPVDAAIEELATYPGIHIGPDRMITRYPVRGGKLLNLVFFARQPGWTEDGWSIPAQASDLTKTFDGWCEDAQAMIAAASHVPLFKWAINARTPLSNLIVDDRITLIGDAAHAMTPFLGQGAACAIEDAIVLARALAESSSSAEGLRRYVAARAERTAFIQRESNDNADRMQGTETDLYGLGKLRNEETLGLFDYDCRTVPV